MYYPPTQLNYPHQNEEWFTIDKQTRIIVRTPKAKEPLHFLTDRLGTVANLTLPVIKTTKDDNNAIIFSLTNDPSLGKEGYSLRATKRNIQIEANEPSGFSMPFKPYYNFSPAKSTLHNGKIAVPGMFRP